MSAVPQPLPMMGMVPPTTPDRSAGKVATTGNHSSVDLATVIPLALSRAGLSHKQACAHMGLDTSNWTKALHANGVHVSLQRLLLLPAAFWCELLPLLAEPHGLSVSRPDLRLTALKQAAQALHAVAVSLEAAS